MGTQWLTLVGVKDTASPQLDLPLSFGNFTAAVWKSLSGGTALNVREPPQYPWVIAVESSDPGSLQKVVDYIFSSSRTDAAGEPETFQEIYRCDNAINIADDDRDVFVVRISARDTSLETLNHWYNFVHLPEVNRAGLLGGRRFKAVKSKRTFLALYRPETVDVLRSEAISAIRGFGGFEGSIEEFSRLEARTVARYSGVSR